jgi:hypothetical protein
MVVEGKRGEVVSTSRDPPMEALSTPTEQCIELYSEYLTERANIVLRALGKLVNQLPHQAPLASAFLLHAILLSHIPLSARRLKDIRLAEKSIPRYRNFLDGFATEALRDISHPSWSPQFDSSDRQCDLVDLVDGRLFKTVLFAIQGRVNARALLSKDIIQEFDSGCSCRDEEPCPVMPYG